MTSGGREVDVGGEEPNCQNNAQDHPFERSLGLQTLVWWKLLVLTGKKLAFKFSTYMFEYGLLSPYVHLESTHVMNAPRPSPCLNFRQSSNSMYYCKRKREIKTGGLGTRLTQIPPQCYLGQYQLVYQECILWASKCFVIVAFPNHLMLLHKQCLHHTGPLGDTRARSGSSWRAS